MRRTPSLRELRLNCPDNVVILPTAPSRQVKQRYGRTYGPAKRALIASQSVEFPYRAPWTREEDRQAQSLELRPDVPPFDPGNPRHLRAWEAIWDFGKRSWPSDGE